MNAGQLAALIAAGFFAVGMCAAVYRAAPAGPADLRGHPDADRLPRQRRHLLSTARRRRSTGPTSSSPGPTSITASMDEVTANMAELSGHVSALDGPGPRRSRRRLGAPLLRVSALAYGSAGPSGCAPRGGRLSPAANWAAGLPGTAGPRWDRPARGACHRQAASGGREPSAAGRRRRGGDPQAVLAGRGAVLGVTGYRRLSQAGALGPAGTARQALPASARRPGGRAPDRWRAARDAPSRTTCATAWSCTWIVTPGSRPYPRRSAGVAARPPGRAVARTGPRPRYIDYAKDGR